MAAAATLSSSRGPIGARLAAFGVSNDACLDSTESGAILKDLGR